MWRVEATAFNRFNAGLPNKMLYAELAFTTKYRKLSVREASPSVNVVLNSR